MTLAIATEQLHSRLFLGTGKFGSHELMREAVRASGSQLVTAAMKRIDGSSQGLLASLALPGIQILPNTSGARNADEAVLLAELAREALETEWLKLEIHPEVRYLMPDPIETLEATRRLAEMGFIVLPYCGADPGLCKRLEEAGAAAVMPLGAPIGSNRGLETRAMLEIIIDLSTVPVIVDAGLGAPSQAAEAMELGADAVLVNTAIAVADDPVQMATAFRLAVEAGRLAFEARLGPSSREAVPTSPLAGLFE